ncbi:leucyl aminopeptidase [Thalassospiraceae bacterium LMO-SO8]|nr:leucyl aminopeptidase [Alphaproteobacteria bacterium LMO-S08]WND76072.1 leucyl aminopeptidase [Thalassospiraceae bacterium LMO-SO8]
MKITFANPALPAQGVVVVTATEDAKLSKSATVLDVKLGGAITRAAKAAKFKGKAGESLDLMAPNTKFERVVVVGLGKPGELKDLGLQDAGGRIYALLSGQGAAATVVLDAVEGADIAAADMAANLGFGALLRSYRFDKYRTKEPKEKKPVLKSIKVLCPTSAKAKAAFTDMEKVAEGVFFTRDLVSEPPNVLYPATLAKEALALKKLGVKVTVLGEKEMTRLGMGALLGVGQGSARESKMVIMEWTGVAKSKPAKAQQPVAFVGKGVTFDTGGISIKPAAGMEDMKWDMGGSGVVIGLMKALAGRKAKVNAVGVVGLVENMPGGNAQRPSDIVKSMSGQTIEVLNTDAEGRLVLADALWYTQTKFKPKFVVDLATLTGAIIVALGNERAGMYANDDALADQIFQAGEAVDELVWRMPLGKAYDELINSDAADMQNIGGRWGGSITAAQFLQRFIKDGTPWVHLDIAGTTWSKKAKPVTPKGGTGYGVRLLDRLVADHYEAK